MGKRVELEGGSGAMGAMDAMGAMAQWLSGRRGGATALWWRGSDAVGGGHGAWWRTYLK